MVVIAPTAPSNLHAPIPLIPVPNTKTFLLFNSISPPSYIPINATRHNKAVTIEKTATTLVSDHPHNSK